MTLLEWTLTYARRGWPVCPCSPENKRPLPPLDRDESGAPVPSTGGIKKASRDEAQISPWWTQSPDAMIAIATSENAGVFVVDLDAGHDETTGEDFTAEELLCNLENEIGVTLAPTWKVRTPRGGWHLYFAFPYGEAVESRLRASPCAIGNRVNMIPRVDVRGNGGYVIAPPSARPDGAAYTCEAEPSRADERPADAPPERGRPRRSDC